MTDTRLTQEVMGDFGQHLADMRARPAPAHWPKVDTDRLAEEANARQRQADIDYLDHVARRNFDDAIGSAILRQPEQPAGWSVTWFAVALAAGIALGAATVIWPGVV